MRIALTKVGDEIGAIHVRLSRRNIMSLLHMLDDRDKVQPALAGRDQYVEILVEAQEDDEHYGGGPIGKMSWER